MSSGGDYLHHAFIAESLRAAAAAGAGSASGGGVPRGTPLEELFKPFSHFFPSAGRSVEEVEGIIGALWHGVFTWPFGTLITENGKVVAIYLPEPEPEWPV